MYGKNHSTNQQSISAKHETMFRVSWAHPPPLQCSVWGHREPQGKIQDPELGSSASRGSLRLWIAATYVARAVRVPRADNPKR